MIYLGMSTFYTQFGSTSAGEKLPLEKHVQKTENNNIYIRLAFSSS